MFVISILLWWIIELTLLVILGVGNILCSFEQMGIFDELVRVSKPTYDATYYSAELKKTAHICVQDEM